MKKTSVVLLLVLSVSLGLAQDYAKTFGAPFVKTAYGATYFKSDSTGIKSSTTSQVYTVTITYDTTAGSTVAYWCAGNDSLNAVPLRPGTGGAYGDGRTFRVKGVRFFRVKGAVPITTVIE